MKIATFEDLDLILEMGLRFADEASMPSSKEDIQDSVSKWLEDENSVIFVSEHGMACASLAPLFFNKSILVAQENFWWIDRSYRKKGYGQKFLMTLENWAKENGAKALLMIALMSSEPEKAAAIYIKNNYLPFEQGFIKYL